MKFLINEEEKIECRISENDITSLFSNTIKKTLEEWYFDTNKITLEDLPIHIKQYLVEALNKKQISVLEKEKRTFKNSPLKRIIGTGKIFRFQSNLAKVIQEHKNYINKKDIRPLVNNILSQKKPIPKNMENAIIDICEREIPNIREIIKEHKEEFETIKKTRKQK